MKKIGIFGGTFNPIHNGHLNIAKKIGNSLGLDVIHIIPANVPPHKSYIPIMEGKHRYEMCRLACEGDPLFKLNDIELKKEGRSYTVDTLNEISIDYKYSKLFLILGSDSFLSITNWVGFEEITKLAVLCTTPRDIKEVAQLNKMDQLFKSRGVETIIFDIPVIPISSTLIRKRIQNRMEIHEMVPRNVADYIKINNLYNKIEYEDSNIK
ncbi:nicotinate-nucleotide adenylyltransferase [Sedimentibacter acidaminivorans]|uniref:Probable nicotinate-nucleotide adenylyltransferase n=1 Tax=Sedimentibacter acidaminivorans TaxID=913099 RepID=A0ABS4GFH6_9FIRM|nr:nicotinate-nucleotide adenylyltransferase [Sedimentibacter acidaminivorans]MBP1926434.1 nicotinate-nucleotide adenylyltransferase [Sedimentibacter acidaminivorans]